MIRRLLDVTVALILVIPVLALTAVLSLAIVVVDGYAPLFLQERLGRGGKLFTCIKLQTIPPAGGPLGDDYPDRVREATRLGRWLRDRALDELPQVFNVLFGQMSFTGPRPLIPQTYDRIKRMNPDLFSEIDAWTQLRLQARPGLFGWHMANGLGQGIIRHDVDYLADPSWHKNWLILWRALACLVAGRTRALGRVLVKT